MPELQETAIMKGTLVIMLIGVKSVLMSKPASLFSTVSDAVEVVPNKSVYPSGFEAAAARAPIEPDAPALFSTTNGCPITACRLFAT
ncbi:hypothetical protein SB724_20115, partial [Bacillus sp. SIMBA_031]